MSRRRILLAQSAQESGVLATATGNPMTFTTDLVRRLHSLVIPFTPIQAAGTPSPENPLPISGWTEANVYNETAYNASATPKLNINWQTEAGTIYGGTITLNDDGSADMVVDRTFAQKTLLEASSYTVGEVMDYYRFNNCFPAAPVEPGSSVGKISNIARYSYNGADYQVPHFYILATNAVLLYVPHGTPTDIVFQVVSPIQTPITYHFDNIGQLYTYLGTNTIWTDTNSTNTVEYWIKNL